jgi:hypothetical protein
LIGDSLHQSWSEECTPVIEIRTPAGFCPNPLGPAKNSAAGAGVLGDEFEIISSGTAGKRYLFDVKYVYPLRMFHRCCNVCHTWCDPQAVDHCAWNLDNNMVATLELIKHIDSGQQNEDYASTFHILKSISTAYEETGCLDASKRIMNYEKELSQCVLDYRNLLFPRPDQYFGCEHDGVVCDGVMIGPDFSLGVFTSASDSKIGSTGFSLPATRIMLSKAKKNAELRDSVERYLNYGHKSQQAYQSMLTDVKNAAVENPRLLVILFILEISPVRIASSAFACMMTH